MLDRLLNALCGSKNDAADDLLLQALRLGSEQEKMVALTTIIRRGTSRGMGAVIGMFDALPDSLKLHIINNIKAFHAALRESGRSSDMPRRLSALKLIALGRQGKLAYVLSENIHDPDQTLAKAAVDALVALARFVATETRRLQRGGAAVADDPATVDAESSVEFANAYAAVISNRGEIEQAVARAIDMHRGKFGAELLRAALLLCDWPGSKTLAILSTTKHGGQSPMVRRLQQPPASEHVEAFLLGASHGGLRSHFGIVFSHINEAPVLDALLRKTHWLKDHQLALCIHQVTRGVWWSEGELLHDIERRDPQNAALIAQWICASGLHDVVQDERIEKLRIHAANDFAARLAIFRAAARRPRNTSCALFKAFLNDPDERLQRMAAREIVRRRPPDMENMLLQLMTNAPESVRRVVSRAIGQEGFENFWVRFDRLDRSTRRSAGKAMLKILPDGITRLGRKLSGGQLPQKLKALAIVQELEVADQLRPLLVQLCHDPQPRLRSKAIALLGALPTMTADVLVERIVNDTDPRVRANAIEALETKHKPDYVPLITARARSANSRERANAIKALHRMKVGTAGPQLLSMLKDERPEHRISGLWALRQIGWWQMLSEVAQIAKEDPNLRVRKYALTLLRTVADAIKREEAAKAAG